MILYYFLTHYNLHYWMSWIYYVSVKFAGLHNSVHLVSSRLTACNAQSSYLTSVLKMHVFNFITLFWSVAHSGHPFIEATVTQQMYKKVSVSLDSWTTLLDGSEGVEVSCDWRRAGHVTTVLLWLEVGGEVECGLVCLEASSCSALRYDRDTGTCFTAQLVRTHTQTHALVILICL